MNLFNMIEPLSLTQERELFRWAKMTISLVSLSILCFGSYSLYYWLAIRGLHNRAMILQARIAHTPYKEEYAALKEQYANVQQKEEAYANSNHKREIVASLLTLIPQTIPANLRFTRLHIKENGTLLCQVESNASDTANSCQECLSFFSNLPMLNDVQIERIVSRQSNQSGALIDMRCTLAS